MSSVGLLVGGLRALKSGMYVHHRRSDGRELMVSSRD